MKTINMKKYLATFILLLIATLPFTVEALSVGWDRYIVGGLRTLYSGDKVLIGGTATTSSANLEVQGVGYISTQLGIGTSSPYAALSVVGSTGVVAEKYNATGTATSSFAWDINIASGHCIQYNGSCISLSGGGFIADWVQQSNYGALALTPSSTIPVWIKGNLYASSSAIVAGSVTADSFSATNTLGTSTFAGGITGPDNFVVQQTTGNVGVGTLSPAALINSLGTTEQLRLSYDASNYASFTVGPTGTLTLSSSLTTPGTIIANILKTNATADNANFAAQTGAGVVNRITNQLLLPDATSTDTRVTFRGSTNGTLTWGANYASLDVGQQAVTENAAGNHPLLSQLALRPLAVTAGGATVSNTATLYIEDGATSTTATIGNYALWVDNGISRFDGSVGIGTTSPYAALSVVGSTGVVAEKYSATGTATSTFAWDINIATGHCIQYNGSCISLTGGTSGATTTWRSIVQAWIYPGETTCQADEEYKDGRQIHTLKPEYIALNNNGTHAIDTVAVSGCNGYSVDNAQDVASSSAEQFFTISGNATGFAALMGSASLQASLIATSTAYATSTGFTGVEIDIEGYASWSAADTLTYYTFLTNFANTLHANGKKLMVDLPPIWNSAANTDSGTGDEWDSANSTGYYNLTYQAMNATPVDYFVIMAYDYHFDYGGGASIQPLKWVGDIVAFAKKKIPDTNRIVIGMPAYGYQATTAGYDITNQTYGLMTLETGFGTAVRDGASGEMKWTNGGQSYVYNDSVSLDIKRTYIESLGISRVSVWHLGDNLWFTSPEESGGKMEMGNLPQVVREATTTLQSLALGGTSTPSAQFEIKGLMPTLVRIFTSTGTKVMEIIDDLVNFENARVRQHVYRTFTYATSTSWTSSSTIPLGIAGVSETWNKSWCFTDTGTLNVVYKNNTSLMNLFNASTTVGTTTLSTNNAIPAGTKRYVEVGTPASSPTSISCTVDVTVNK